MVRRPAMVFTPSFATISAPDGAPRALAIVLHGIYGTGGNWRTVARKVAARRPEWGFVLVDLREHGRSRGAPPPHTVAAAAADLDAVVAAVREVAPVRGMIAHSFGGKVALAFRDRGGAELAQAWIVDSSPSRRPQAMRGDSDVVRVLELLESLPPGFPSREAFVDEVTGRGFSPMLAQWLGMNVEVTSEGARLAMDLEAIRSLLTDYFDRDAWLEVEREGAPGELRFIIGERSQSLSTADRDRLDALATARPEAFSVHRLDAGHWVHVEAREPLVELIATNLAPA